MIPKFKKLRERKTLVLGDEPDVVTKQLKFPSDVIIGIMSDYHCTPLNDLILSQCAFIRIESLTQLSARVKSILETFDVVFINSLDMIAAPGHNSKKDRGALIRGILAKSTGHVVREGKTLIVSSCIKETATVESVDEVIRC